MRTIYTCKDGSETVSDIPSLALLFWYTRYRDTRIVPAPYGQKFLELVVELVEEKCGKIESHLRSYPEAPLPDNTKHWDVDELKSLYNCGEPNVVRYEAYCLELIKWLYCMGEITSLSLDGIPVKPKRYRSIDD